MDACLAPMGPNDLLTMAWKWQRGDVSRLTDGDLSATQGRVIAKTFVMSIDEDMFFSRATAPPNRSSSRAASYAPSRAPAGHLDLFGFEESYVPQIDRHLRDLLSSPV